MVESDWNQRAEKYVGKPAKDVPGGGDCSKWTAYVLLGDENKNLGGVKGWTNYGNKCSNKYADFISSPSNVAPIVKEIVYYCPGFGSNDPIKKYSIADAQKSFFENKGKLWQIIKKVV